MAPHPLQKAATFVRRAFMAAAVMAAGTGAAAPPSPATAGARVQQGLDAYLRANPNPHHSRAVVLDPETFDENIGKGMTPAQAIGNMLARRGVHGYSAREKSLLAGFMIYPVFSAQGEPVFSVKSEGKKADICLIIAAPDDYAYDAQYAIPGMDRETARAFHNYHESWHCKDRMTDVGKRDRLGREAMALPPRLQLYSDDAMEAMAMKHKSEVLADVGAVGDMIRDGRGLDVLDAVERWRALRAAGDEAHGSTPALWALRRHILRAGIGAFRRMDDRAAERLYMHIAENDNWIGAPGAYRQYLLVTNGVGSVEQDTRAAAEGGDAQARKVMLAYGMHKWSRIMNRTAIPRPETPEAHLASVWDADAALRERARADSGVVTRASLWRAYGVMRRELNAVRDSDFHAEKAVKLRTAFLKASLNIDIQVKGGELKTVYRHPLHQLAMR